VQKSLKIFAVLPTGNVQLQADRRFSCVRRIIDFAIRC